MIEPGRKYNQGSKSYRYSINGQEKTPEIFEGSTTAMYWEYDSRIGRRWNIDPVTKDDESPYLTFGGNPIVMMDPLGDDWYKNKKSGNIDWFDGSGKHKGYGKSLGVNFWSKTNSKGVKVWYGNSKDEEWQDKTLDAVVVKGTTSKHTLADDAFSWANYDRYEAKIWIDQTITYKQLRNIGLSQKEISKNGFGLPSDRLSVFENYWQSEQDWRSMNYAILDFATFFVPVPKLGMLRWLKYGGNTFKDAKILIWAKNAKPIFNVLRNPEAGGKAFKVFAEVHHRFIPQRWGFPNWITNSRLNLQITNSIEHAVLDPYRYQFLPKWVKDAVDAGALKGVYY